MIKQVMALVALSFLTGAALAPPASEPDGRHQFNILKETLITGGQPSPAELKALAAAGVTKVVNLRGPDEDPGFSEKAEVEALGLKYVSLPITGAGDISLENAAKLNATLQSAEKVFLHCASGNRVGALLAIRAHEIHGESVEEALQLGRAAGLGSLEEKVRMILNEGS